MKFFLLILVFCFSLKSYSQLSTDSSKSTYNLFHSTPKNLMRGFETDRPDATESPITLDAGHFQYETDIFKTEWAHLDGIKIINNFYNAANVKFGITNTLDLQFVAETFTTLSTKFQSGTTKESGFGNFTIRAKQNLWGNDGGKTAFGILPFVNIPVHSGENFSGGIVFPFAASLSNGWNFGTQIETDFVTIRPTNNYCVNFLISGTTSHSIIKDLDFFVEAVALRNNEIKTFEYFLDGGFTYSLKKNLNIDTGAYYGVKNISSTTFFVGLSFRI